MKQFPFVIYNGFMKSPNSEYAHRPESSKSSVSVLYAINAAGDFPKPFIVNPTGLDANEEESCSVERWLIDTVLTYSSEQRQARDSNILLLFRAELALLDKQVLKNVQKAITELNFVRLNTEAIQPVACLFKVR
jgi:hypothetical protein